MAVTLEKIDIIMERANVTYEEAKEALAKSEGDLVEALIQLERNEKIKKNKKKVSETINETSTGEYVRLQGVIQSYFMPERLTIFNLTDETGSIKTIFFSQVPAWNGQHVEITGRITVYKGELELKGVKMKLLR